MANPSRDHGTTASYFPFVDALRAFAALSVIVLHVIHHAGWTAFPTTGLLSWFRVGDLGVDLFFVVSGFAIMYSAAPILAKEGYSRFLAIFAVRRLARIYPLYLLTLFAALFLVHRELLSAPSVGMHVASHVFMFHTFNLDWFSSINGVNWTIAIEMQFYVLFALLLPILVGRRGWLVFIAFVAIAWAWRWMAVHTVTDQTDPLYAYKLFTLSTQTPGRLDVFAAGMAVAVLLRLPVFQKPVISPYVLAASGLATLTLLYVFVFPGRIHWPSLEVAFVLQKSTIAVAFASLVLFACLIRARSMIWLATPLRYLGTISYGLYLWHLPVLMLLKDRGLQPQVVCLLTLGLTILLAAASWHLLEKPMVALARNWSPRFRRAGADVAPA